MHVSPLRRLFPAILCALALAASAQAAGERPQVVYASLVILLVIGAVLTFKAYGPRESHQEGRAEPPAAS